MISQLAQGQELSQLTARSAADDRARCAGVLEVLYCRTQRMVGHKAAVGRQRQTGHGTCLVRHQPPVGPYSQVSTTISPCKFWPGQRCYCDSNGATRESYAAVQLSRAAQEPFAAVARNNEHWQLGTRQGTQGKGLALIVEAVCGSDWVDHQLLQHTGRVSAAPISRGALRKTASQRSLLPNILNQATAGMCKEVNVNSNLSDGACEEVRLLD